MAPMALCLSASTTKSFECNAIGFSFPADCIISQALEFDLVQEAAGAFCGEMSGNSRLSIAIHALILLDAHAAEGKGHATSEQIAQSVNTNPVVVRRLLPALVEAGLLAADRGPHGGYRLTRDTARITVADVYRAIADGPLFGKPEHPNLNCPVGRCAEGALSALYGEAEEQVLRAFSKRSIRELVREFARA